MHSIYCEATLCTYLPTCLPACLPIYLSIESSFDPFIQPANQPTIYVCVSISLYIYLFIIYICVYTHQMISYAYVCSILCKWFFLQDIHVFSLQCKFTLFSSHNTWLHMFFVCAPFNRAAKQHVKRSMWGMSGEKSCSLLGQMFSLYLRNDTFYFLLSAAKLQFPLSGRFPHSQPSMCDCSCGSVRLMLQTRGTAGSTRNPFAGGQCACHLKNACPPLRNGSVMASLRYIWQYSKYRTIFTVSTVSTSSTIPFDYTINLS